MVGNGTYGTISWGNNNTTTSASVTGWTTYGAATTTSSAVNDWNDALTYGGLAANYKAFKNQYLCEWKDWGEPEVREVIPKKLPPGARTLELPDGAKLVVDDAGNYRIEDTDAKVTYRANRVREFSPHLNASDMLAQFVQYVGGLGVKRADVMGLPLHLFVSWLIIEAAERDGDQVPSDVIPVAQDPAIIAACKPKCLTCGRFVRRIHQQHRFPFCSPAHGSVYAARRGFVPGPRTPRLTRLADDLEAAGY